MVLTRTVYVWAFAVGNSWGRLSKFYGLPGVVVVVVVHEASGQLGLRSCRSGARFPVGIWLGALLYGRVAYLRSPVDAA